MFSSISISKDFTSNVSHELRTPLTVISGYLDMLETAELLPAPLQKQVTNANQQAVRMQKILHDLLSQNLHSFVIATLKLLHLTRALSLLFQFGSVFPKS